MTHDETRDELARLDGWVKQYIGWWTTDGLKSSYNHPHAPTLDGANAAVPEGYRWNRRPNARGVPSWFGWHVHDDADVPLVEVPDHGRGHEMADLYALALACRRAMEEKR